MESIINTNGAYESFVFSKLQLIKPTLVSGGNYFIRCLVDGEPLYIQPPKCYTKQGIVKASGGKRFFTDLMFTNENESFIHWMEKLEAHCQQTIFKNRQQWFDNELELDDVESYFTSPLKLFKSGKFYIARINISNVLGKPTIKFYNEDGEEIDFESINDKLNVMTILEIQGIKCSAKSFQIEIELKQMMALKQQILFDKCLFKTKESKSSEDTIETNNAIASLFLAENQIHNTLAENTNNDNYNTVNRNEQQDVEESEPEQEPEPIKEVIDAPTQKKKPNDLEEVVFHLDELPDSESIQIKQRTEVYYEMYREARKKAKIARDLALAAYLEAKEIKNTYMLTDLNSDSDSDSDSEGDGHGYDDDGRCEGDENEDLENDIEELADSFESRDKIKIEV